MPAREDEDPGQTRAIETWFRDVLANCGIVTIKMPGDDGPVLGISGVEPKAGLALGALYQGILAAARGEELPPVDEVAPRIQRAKKRSRR